ncbi:RNA recognition motif domain-containing protein [Ditylenchus destructor]|nr:RNA recognition motif domain-containing protein [Ditylenchus destructor]
MGMFRLKQNFQLFFIRKRCNFVIKIGTRRLSWFYKMSFNNFGKRMERNTEPNTVWDLSSTFNNNAMQQQRLFSLDRFDQQGRPEEEPHLPPTSPYMTTSPSIYSPIFGPSTPLNQNWETSEVNRQQPIQEYQISERAREAFFFGPTFSATVESGCQDTERVAYPRRRKPSSPAIFLQQYSTKVFVGGLPIGIVCETLYNNFIVFGPLKIDWPKKTSEHSNPTDGIYFPNL